MLLEPRSSSQAGISGNLGYKNRIGRTVGVWFVEDGDATEAWVCTQYPGTM
jgi:hypothetical protein